MKEKLWKKKARQHAEKMYNIVLTKHYRDMEKFAKKTARKEK